MQYLNQFTKKKAVTSTAKKPKNQKSNEKKSFEKHIYL